MRTMLAVGQNRWGTRHNVQHCPSRTRHSIDETPAHELSRNIKEEFGKALNSESEIDPDVLTTVGMSGGKYRHS